MPAISIRDVDVDFPFKPYECQKAYMDKVIECLQKGENGILESPTGTGKTLCLLCATLSWRQTFIAKMQLGQQIVSHTSSDGVSFKDNLGNKLQDGAGIEGKGDNSRGFFCEVPKIIYASRTHSQLTQVIQELKSTVYRPKVSIIGSREQLCINPDVLKQETNSAKIHMCRAKVSARTCPFYNNLEAKKSERDFNTEILDIEDLVKLGQKHKACPYYMARELKTGADITFMPYNYLLDAKLRKAHNLDLSGSIVIFDEAHNIEKICEDTVSFDLSSFDIASCVEDVILCMEFFANKEAAVEMGDEPNVQDVDIEDVKLLKALFSKLEEEIDKIPLPKEGGQSFPSSFMIDLMMKCGITPSTKTQVLELLEKLNPILASDTKGLKGKHFALSKFAEALQIIFDDVPNSRTPSDKQEDPVDNSRSYKVYVKIEPDSKKKQKNLDVWTSGSKSEKRGRTLSYWCFSPGYAMKNLMAHGIRALILTSGTLSPLSSFTAELQIKFPMQLENPHVIQKHQVWVGIVTKAPDGATLNSSFEFRSTIEYMNGIGNTIANVACIVPNGLLVFFPSYPVMNKCLEHWQNTGIWSRIVQHKAAFAEPKGKGDFSQVIEDFYSKIKDPKLNGATFFAVCRGKVSEGLDFSDINGRAVVITGLPFPPKMDPKVNLKMNFLDEMLRKHKRTFKSLSGREWYRQQASRAVNQAIGRVIRHRQDYGAILLCDVRFTYPDALKQLPLWIRPHVKTFKEFGHVHRELIQFFRTADKLVDKSAMKTKQNAQEEIKPNLETNTSEVTCKMSMPPPRSGSAIEFNPRLKPPLKGNAQKPYEAAQASRNKDSKALPRLSVQYESNLKSCKPCNEIRPRSSLVDSLAFSEALQSSQSSKQEESCSKPSISDSIIGKRRLENQQRTKKVYKIVKSKTTANMEQEEKNPVSQKSQKVQEAKDYIAKVRKSLDGDNYKAFTNVLMHYKKTNDLQTLIAGLTPLFTQDQSMYTLFLDFSSYVRHCEDKLKFFKAFKDITGQDVPAVYMEGLRIKKRQEPDFEQNCKVGKRMKLEENSKLVLAAKEKGISKDKLTVKDEDFGAKKLALLDNLTHLNRGK